VITEKKVDHLHVNMAGNPASPMPTMLAGLPGMEAFAAHKMKKSMEDLSLPSAREMIDNHYRTTDCQAYPDFREMFARRDIDAVLIATGNRWQ
jgi:predicted dehydrogenase